MDNTLSIGSKVETGLGKQFLQGSKEKNQHKEYSCGRKFKAHKLQQQEET